MIFDKLERLAQYKGLNANLDQLIDYALSNDMKALAPGKTPVGEDCWFSRIVAELSATPDLYERHQEYIDLQIPLEAGEVITVAPMEALDWPDAAEETLFTHGAGGVALDMVPGTFAVFFPGDAHCCGRSQAGQQKAQKLVGKAKA